MAGRCRQVLVDPPMAMSTAMAFSKASRVMMSRGEEAALDHGHQEVGGAAGQGQAGAVDGGGEERRRGRSCRAPRPACSWCWRCPSWRRSHRPGTAARASASSSAAGRAPLSTALGLDDVGIADALPAAVAAGGHPAAGDQDGRMFSQPAAISMPGVILSQLVTRTNASRACAVTMASMESAIISRETIGMRMPAWPVARPSQMAMEGNSSGGRRPRRGPA